MRDETFWSLYAVWWFVPFAIGCVIGKSASTALAGMGLAVLWLLPLAFRSFRPRLSQVVALAGVLVFWIPMLVQTGRRLHFVISNGGMDSAEEPSSPVAFLITFAFEQVVFFLPLTTMLYCGLSSLWHLQTAPQQVEDQSTRPLASDPHDR